jgi:uncharacterized caspase-like protein
VSLSSHGFEDASVPCITPADGLKSFLSDTAVKLATIEDQMRNSKAGHRLLLVDACQEKVSVATEKAISVRATIAMSSTFSDILKKPTGQAKLASCDVGELSYEHPELRGCGHGVFTSTLLDALEGGAAANAQDFVTIKSVADYVQTGVRTCL